MDRAVENPVSRQLAFAGIRRKVGSRRRLLPSISYLLDDIADRIAHGSVSLFTRGGTLDRNGYLKSAP